MRLAFQFAFVLILWPCWTGIVAEEIRITNGTQKEAARLLREAQEQVGKGLKDLARVSAEDLERVAERGWGPKNTGFAFMLHKIGHIHQDLGDLAKAEEFHEKSINVFAGIDAGGSAGMADVLMCAAYIDKIRGRFARAEERLRKALAILEERLPNSPHPIRCRGRLADLLLQHDRYMEALALLDEVLASKQDLSKLDVRSQFEFWMSYADAYLHLRRLPEAEKAAQRVLDLLPRLGETHRLMSVNVHQLMGNLYCSKGDYTQARTAFSRALAISEEVHGKEHFQLIHPLLWVASLEDDFGHYDLAEESLRRAQQLCTTQQVSPETLAEATQSLAGLLLKTGRLLEAEVLYGRALEQQKAAGREDWVLLNNVGGFYETIGKYEEAGQFLQQALAVAEKQHGSEHAALLTPLLNLADLSFLLGRHAERKALIRQNVAIATKVYGPEHIRTASSLLQLSYLAWEEERLADAIELQKKVLATYQKCYGPDGFKTLEMESILAESYLLNGNFAEAETILRRVLPTAEAIKGYTTLPRLKRRLGTALMGLSRFDEAVKALQESLDGFRALHGPNHLDTAYALRQSGYLEAGVGRHQQALAVFQETIRAEDRIKDQVGGFSSEQQRVEFVLTQVATGHALLTLCLEQMADDPAARSAALDLLLHRQGAVLADVQRERLAAREAGDPALAETMTKRRRHAATLSHLMLAGPGNRDPKDYQAQLEDLRKQINELEAEWARKSTAFREQTRQQQLTAADLKQVLSADAAFVQIAAYRQKNFKEVAESKTWGPHQYAALILTKDSESPTLVKLGAAEPIEKAIAACRSATQKMTKPQERTAGDDWLKAAAEVRRFVWDPLAAALKDRRKVYLVPDGELNFVAFGALPLENGKFLLEEREVALLSNGRDLLRETIASKEGTVLALAAPEFGGIATAQEEVAFARGLFRSHLAGRAGFDRLGAFNPLPGTLAEAKSIEALCREKARKVEVHTGAEATEARLKSAARPAVLHLATHGFFLPEPDDAKKNDSAVRNALLRSGLALAGANRLLKGEAPPADQEDGLVTAEEITGLDLWGTKLVVLSACQTALGESRGGEGVFGLRRAFLLAGAEHLVMSLWSVPDKETQELMTGFYKQHLGGSSPGHALREAQLEYLRRAKAENRSTHPFYWGAFVHTGIGVE